MAAFAGHAKTSTTVEVYSHPLPQRAHEAARRMRPVSYAAASSERRSDVEAYERGRPARPGDTNDDDTIMPGWAAHGKQVGGKHSSKHL